MLDLEADPTTAARLCVEAQERLMVTVSDLDDATVAAPSRLPGWHVGHVLSHLARNADAHGRRIRGALQGEDVAKYSGPPGQREAEISVGASRPAAELIADLAASQADLAGLFAEAESAGWPNAHFTGGGSYGVAASPAHRLREVEMHHVDLGLGYTSRDWPAEYVEWDLDVLLGTVPGRLSSDDRRSFMAWLAGRAALTRVPHLRAWG